MTDVRAWVCVLVQYIAGVRRGPFRHGLLLLPLYIFVTALMLASAALRVASYITLIKAARSVTTLLRAMLPVYSALKASAETDSVYGSDG